MSGDNCEYNGNIFVSTNINKCSLNSQQKEDGLDISRDISDNNEKQKDTDACYKHNTTFKFTTKGLHVAHLNTQHLMPKLDEIKNILNEPNTADIFTLSETFLTDTVQNGELHITNYVFERRDRNCKAGGGLLIYISDNISYSRRKDIETNSIESIWLQINFPHNKSVLINNVYRPPNSLQCWIDEYEKQLLIAESTHLKIISIGDYNIDYISPNVYKNTKWSKLVHDFGLVQLVNVPTRVTKTSSTIIDHIYTSCPEIVCDISVPCVNLSDHYPVVLTLSHKQFHYIAAKHKTIRYRSFSKFNENDFINDLSQIDFNIIETIADPNTSLELMYDMLNNLLTQHAPITIKRVKRHQQPGWYTDEIKQARITRDKYKHKKDWDQYKMWRNKCISIVRNSKRSFFSNAIKDKKDAKYLWQGLKIVINNDTKAQNIPNNICVDDVQIEGKQNVANALNTHFVNIARIIKKENLHEGNFEPLKAYVNSKLNNVEFDIKFITTNEVEKMIHCLDSNKSTGLDGIGSNILKICKHHLTIAITAIINNCISKGIFPDTLKTASVIPIYKGGCREDPSNYRPISILPTLSKLFEKHVANQLKSFFARTNILYLYQSGFREKHSCQTALIRLVDSWLADIDAGKYVGTVFLDFKKAFDLVDHKILLHKLKLYHFSNKAVNFFESYLSNRSQIVKIENVQSEKANITSGVPQGSILGPLLFLLYVNDLPLCLSSDTDMYADDTTIHTTDVKLDCVQSKLQSDLYKVNRWCKINNMAINPKKTTCMILCTKQKHTNSKVLTLKIGNAEIENVTSQKLLGVYIDNCLTWKTHIDKTCNKLSSKLFLLRRIGSYLSLEMKQMFYTAYITPILDYGCITWQHACKSDLNRLTKIQKRTARIILHKSWKDDAIELIKNLNWLSVPKRTEYYTGLMVFKSMHSLTPSYISQLITVAKNNHYNLRTESHRDITHVKPRTNYLKQTFSYSGMKVWNAIPLHIRNINILGTFKLHYKLFLMND